MSQNLVRPGFICPALLALLPVLCQHASVAIAGKVAIGSTAPTLDQVIDGFDSIEKRFFGAESFLLVYERTATQDVTPSIASGGLLPASWRIAYKGNQWLIERRFTKPYVTKNVEVPAAPKTEVVRKHLVLEDTPENHRALLTRFDLGQNTYRGLFYTINLSLNAPKFIAVSNGVSDRMDEIRHRYPDDFDLPFLPDFLRQNRSHYSVSQTPDVVDGTMCWIVEWPGMDRIWVDPRRGYVAPRRAYCWGEGKPLRLEIHNKDYREVASGLWLPFAQIVDEYASVKAENRSIWGKVTCRSEYKVQSVGFNNLTDDFFDVHLPARTVVLDTVRRFEYVVPDADADDPFENAINDVRVATRPWWAYLLVALNVAVILLIIALYIRRASVNRVRQ